MKHYRRDFPVSSAIYFVAGFILGVILFNSFSYVLLKDSLLRCRRPQQLSQNEEMNVPLPRLNQYEEPFLFVAVMTTRNYINTRAAAISRSWGKHVPGKIIFFLGKGEEYKGDLPVVVLEDVADNAYPPQKKSFTMLKYVRDHYIDQFEWFMRVDDDIFMRPKLLERFLRSVNSSKRLYIGQPGLGVPSERGKLGLRNDSFFFCMGGPGIIFSRDTLMRTAAGLDACLERTYTHHEDTELGRCVNEHAKVSCTCAYEFKTMFYQNRGNKNESFGGDLEPELNLALTLHPVKRSPYVYRLQNFFNLKNLVRLKYTANQLEREIRSVDGNLNKASSSHRWNVAHNARSSRRADDDGDVSSDFARDEVWNFVRSNLIYARTHPYQNPYESVVRRGRQLRINATLTVLKRHDASMRKPVFYYEKISTGIGVEHVVAFGNKTFYKPFVSLQRFQAPEIVEVPVRGFAGEVIHMILPVYRRPKTFYNFLRSLNTTAHSFRGKIHLRIVMYQDCFNEHLVSLRHYISFNCKCSNLETELFQLVGPFSKVKAMNKGTEGLPPDALLLFMDLDMIYTASFLDRVILNTKRGKHAFFPISFSQYNPDTLCVGRKDCSFNRLSFDVYQDRGTWRHFGFGIVGIYKDDFFRVGGWDLTIMGWGKEDTLFYEDCFSYGFPVFRSIEPGLVHVHHIKYCNVTLPTDQLNMCLASRVEMYASQAVLADIAYNMPAVKENRE